MDSEMDSKSGNSTSESKSPSESTQEIPVPTISSSKKCRTVQYKNGKQKPSDDKPYHYRGEIPQERRYSVRLSMKATKQEIMKKNLMSLLSTEQSPSKKSKSHKQSKKIFTFSNDVAEASTSTEQRQDTLKSTSVEQEAFESASTSMN